MTKKVRSGRNVKKALKSLSKKKGPGSALKKDSVITQGKEIETGLGKVRKELAIIKKSADEASEFAESVINTVREPLIALDKDLRVVKVSRSFCDFFKVKPEETVGKFIYELGNKQWDIPRLRELLETILAKKTTFDNYEVEHDFATIGRRVMLLNARQIQRAFGRERIILLAIEDITDRKRLEILLKDSEELYKGAFKTASDGILFLEKREGKITHSNPAAEKMLGYSAKECIGNKLQDIGIMLVMDDFQTIMQNLNKNGIINYKDVPLKTKSGKHIVTDIYLVDKTKVVQCNIRDITERKHAKEELRKTDNKLKERIKELKCLYTISGLVAEPFASIAEKLKAAVELIPPNWKFPEIACARIIFEEREFASVNFRDTIWKQFADIVVAGETVGTVEVCYLEERPTLDLGPFLNEEQDMIIDIARQLGVLVMSTRASDALRESELRFKAQYQGIPIPTFTWQKQGEDFELIDCNDAAKVITHEKAFEFIGRKASDLYANRQDILRDIHHCFVERKVIKREISSEHFVPGRLIAVTFVFIPPDLVMVHMEDITERKRVERELHESEARYRAFFNTSKDCVFITSLTGTLLYMNDAAVDLFGYPSREELSQVNIADHYAIPEERAKYINFIEEHGYAKEFPADLRKKDGSLIHVLITAVPRHDAQGNVTGFQGTIRDITERKRMEESLRESEGIFDQFLTASPVLVYVKNEKHKFYKLSKSFEDLFGKPASELIGKDLYDLLPPDLAKIVFEDDLKVLKKGISVIEEEKLNDRFFSSIKFPIHRESGKPDYLGGFSVDITARKRAEDNLKNSLVEKELLLKEVHHRVKNNLMTIIGLIKMQEAKANNEMFSALLLELEGRVRAMALVHESLHKSEDLTHIDLQNYIETMSAHIRVQFGAKRDIRFSVQAAGVQMGLDIVVPCGLILNELIANAYKHAFPGDKPYSGAGNCEINIIVNQEDSMNKLTVADNGIGLPVDLDWEKSEALGLRLVKMLSQQLKGSLEMESSSGTVFRLKFPMVVK